MSEVDHNRISETPEVILRYSEEPVLSLPKESSHERKGLLANQTALKYQLDPSGRYRSPLDDSSRRSTPHPCAGA